MSIYEKKNFDDILINIFNQNVSNKPEKNQKKSDEKYLTFVIQEEEGGFVKSIKGALREIEKQDFKNCLMYLHTAIKSKDKIDFKDLTSLTNMFSNFGPRALKQIFLLTSDIKSMIKEKTESLIPREFYFEESETFGKNISATIKSILSNDFDRATKSLKTSLIQIKNGNKNDFNVKDFNDLINLIKVVDKVNRLRIVDVIDFINYEVETLIEVLKSYKKVNSADKNMLEELKRMVNQIESRGIQDYSYEALKSHVNRLMKSESDDSINTRTLKNSIKGFKSFLIQRSMVHRTK